MRWLDSIILLKRGLSAVTAEYSLRDDGGVRVINSGLSTESGERSEAEGRAYFVEDADQGYLKVSFFGPFFGSYIIFELDAEGYEYAFVAGNNTNYLWLLARTPVVSDEVMERFIEQSKALGFATDELIFVKHPTGQEVAIVSCANSSACGSNACSGGFSSSGTTGFMVSIMPISGWSI